ncbi:MAG: hypothetical protein WCV62_00260 [Candidatus Peribacteraceae bacterium]|jgi:hypothetical protein
MKKALFALLILLPTLAFAASQGRVDRLRRRCLARPATHQWNAQTQRCDRLIGGQKDEHGCLIPAGYSWCEAKQKCLRTWEEACTASSSSSVSGTPVPCAGCDRDVHGCIGSAGYSWCPVKQKCLRVWEEACQ